MFRSLKCLWSVSGLNSRRALKWPAPRGGGRGLSGAGNGGLDALDRRAGCAFESGREDALVSGEDLVDVEEEDRFTRGNSFHLTGLQN